MTNLRLPGQYDERLLGSVGLQGPYYNWNRWYLPGVGRYLELDPIALHGGFNGPYGPDWYNYAEGNPLRNIDPSGEQVPCSPGESSIACKCKQPGGSWACQLKPPDPCGGPKPKPGPPTPTPAPRPAPPVPTPVPNPDPKPKDPKDKCWDDYVWCLNSPIGSMMSNQFGYSQCQVCQEQCIQDGGIWPVLARNNKPCR